MVPWDLWTILQVVVLIAALDYFVIFTVPFLNFILFKKGSRGHILVTLQKNVLLVTHLEKSIAKDYFQRRLFLCPVDKEDMEIRPLILICTNLLIIYKRRQR